MDIHRVFFCHSLSLVKFLSLPLRKFLKIRLICTQLRCEFYQNLVRLNLKAHNIFQNIVGMSYKKIVVNWSFFSYRNFGSTMAKFGRSNVELHFTKNNKYRDVTRIKHHTSWIYECKLYLLNDYFRRLDQVWPTTNNVNLSSFLVFKRWNKWLSERSSTY